MKTIRSKSGPFQEQPYYKPAEIEQICSDELAKFGLLPSEPQAIRIDRFIEKKFRRPHTYEDLDAGILGLTVFGPKGVQEIIVARSLEEEAQNASGERRVRTTLAHEGGHGLLHAHLFVLEPMNKKPLLGDWSEPTKPKVLCREEGQKPTYSGQWWEYQANQAMGALLLPRRLVTIALEPFLQPTGSLGGKRLPQANESKAISALSEIFDVNPVVVKIRLKQIFGDVSSQQLSL